MAFPTADSPAIKRLHARKAVGKKEGATPCQQVLQRVECTQAVRVQPQDAGRVPLCRQGCRRFLQRADQAVGQALHRGGLPFILSLHLLEMSTLFTNMVIMVKHPTPLPASTKPAVVERERKGGLFVWKFKRLNRNDRACHRL